MDTSIMWRRPFAEAEADTLPPGDAFSHRIAPEPRKLAYDSGTDRTGEIWYITRVDHDTTIVWLQPVAGGQLWTTDAANVRLIQPDEAGDCP